MRPSRHLGLRPKALDGGDQVGSESGDTAGDDRGAFARRYEQLRGAMATGSGGWRHGLGVLVAQGMVAWMAAWASLPIAQAEPGADPGRIATAASQADVSLSTATRSSPAPNTNGGDASSSACTSLLPAPSPHATSEIVAVLAQMTLAHARSAVGPTPFTCPGGRSP